MALKKTTSKSDALTEQLRERSLAKYPGATLKRPWPGHLDLVVKDKTFAFLSAPGAPFSISCKLPHSRAAALALPNAAPTRYGLGTRGWITLTGEKLPPLALLEAWVEESYRAQAPKRLVAELDAGKTEPRAKKKETQPKKTPPARTIKKAPKQRGALERASGTRTKGR